MHKYVNFMNERITLSRFTQIGYGVGVKPSYNKLQVLVFIQFFKDALT